MGSGGGRDATSAAGPADLALERREIEQSRIRQVRRLDIAERRKDRVYSAGMIALRPDKDGVIDRYEDRT